MTLTIPQNAMDSQYTSAIPSEAPSHTSSPGPTSVTSASSVDAGDEGTTSPLVKDPTVIVGMACRVPGANSVSKLWEVLEEQKDLQTKMPEDRFNVDAFYHPQGVNKGTTNARFGYFLDQDLSLFDNEFFRISGKEAESMDPQQRLILEVVYEAMEDAGITLDQISGTQTSVYCGSFSNDYSHMIGKDLEQYPKYSVTGLGNAIISNRVSYVYNLHGPSLTLDTACSSSLVCFHLGSSSLQNKESDISIVVGSALHFDPDIYITMTDFGMLSTDGRCRSFDADGSGYVRGEGICAVILKRRSSAEAAGDSIRAIVRGTGSNHDGLKDGLTLPNSKAQAALLRSTYKAAGLSTHDTLLFEAHGTGTKAGDPLETSAIGSVFAEGRDSPLILGSIKSNVGHLEGASGLAGIIKATLSVETGRIMPNMHFNTPNPAIDFKKLKIEVPTKVMEWNSEMRRASVNSFGYGGSNAHVILENYRSNRRSSVSELHLSNEIPVAGRPFLLPLTSHAEKAGKLQASNISKFLQQSSDLAIPDVAHSLSVRRSFHPYRSFAIGKDVESIVQDLSEPKPIAKWTRTLDQKPRVGFVFTGQGAQWYAMGRQLIEQSPLFRQTLERCDEILQSLPDSPNWSCVSELLKSAEDSGLSRSALSQPLCAALQLALVDLLRAWGIIPSAVVGHSSGEVVAAYSSGSLSFENAIICAYYRGLYMSKGVGSGVPGAMMAVGLTENEGIAELKAFKGRIALAAINSPSSLTLSGDEGAILELKQSLDERKIFARQLQVEQAFHSHHMVPLAPAFEKALSSRSSFESRPSKIKMFSSVTARDSNAKSMDGTYWAANMTGMVRYSDALTGILLDDQDEQNVDVLLEIGAHPALKGPSKQIMKTLKLDIPYIASLTRDTPAYESLLATAGQLFALGYQVDLAAVNSNHFMTRSGHISKVTLGKQLRNLPTYAWNHGKFWAETRVIREHRLRPFRHTVLGAPVPGAPSNHPRFRNYLRQSEIPWLSQHVVDGSVIFPAAGYICMAIEAIATLSPDFKNILFRDIMIKSALVISASEVGTEVMLDLEPVTISSTSTSSTWYRFVVCSFDENHQTIEHCHGEVSIGKGDPSTVGTLDAENSFIQTQKATNRGKPKAAYYKQLARLGFGYGENFQLLSGDIESGPGFAMAPMSFRPSDVVSVPFDACILHPTVLDSSFHVMFEAIETLLGKPLDETFLPTSIRTMAISGLLNEQKYTSDEQKFWVKANTKSTGSRTAVNHLSIMSGLTDQILVDISGLEATALGNNAGSDEAKRTLFFRNRWLDAFDRLGTNDTLPSFESIADVMNLFAHQFPNSKILHLSPNLALTKEVLRHLGGRQGERRRFQSITPYSCSSLVLESAKELELEWPGLVDVEEPKNDMYDVVVINESFDSNVMPFLKTGGFVILENSASASKIGVANFDGLDMVQIFKSKTFSAWRKSTPVKVAQADSLALVLSPNASNSVKALAMSIQSSYPGKTATVTITDLQDNIPTSSNIISLVSLDEDLFFDVPRQADRYLAVQKLLTSAGKRIVWVLRGASNETPNPAQALMLGLVRTARNENEDTKFVTLDLSQNCRNERASRAATDLLDTSYAHEDEVAECQGSLRIPRLEANDDFNRKLPSGGWRQPQLEPFNETKKFALKVDKVGHLDTLVLEDEEDVVDADLDDDSIEIHVKASALGLGSTDDYEFGDECAGVVTRIGRNVRQSDFKLGDRVLAFSPGKGVHRSIVQNPAILCHKIQNMDFPTASSLIGASTTAYFSLIDSARLQPGEYCLVHAAAGGVGQMAVQLALHHGAKVIATVNSRSKRDYLKEKFGLTDDMIFNSRDASFVDGVMKVTNGRGCDVALNSLSGELLHATWAAMAPFGRFIEIGKKDINENTKLDMRPFKRNIVYASVDLVTLFDLKKPLLARVMRDCFKLVTDGVIIPPGPITQVSYSEAQKGFRLPQMGKMFEKVVLVPSEDSVSVMPPVYRNSLLFDATKSYLLVGGLGGIGRALAEWAFRRGARHLAFMSRSGTSRSDAKATVDWLTTRNVKVSVFAADVADPKAVEECIGSLDNLAGIFQAAMVLRDTPLAQMTYDQWKTSLSPKVTGTYNLDKALGSRKLDFFVAFSSTSAVIGAMGQANYAAGNSYLDALMLNRRKRGLAGTTMNIGMVSGVGVVAEDAALEKIMEVIGYEPINEEELFYQIEEAVSSQREPCQTYDRTLDQHQIVTGINLQRKDLYWATNSLMRNLYENLDIGVASGKAAGTVNLLLMLQNAASLEERTSLLMDSFINKIASVLAVPVETIQSRNPLSTYGLDSIVAVEFRKWFSKTVSVELALFDILGAKSIESLVAKASKMVPSTSASAASTATVDQATKDVSADASNTVKSSLADELAVIGRPSHVPLSTFQTRLWFLHNLLEDPAALNLAITSFLKGRPNLATLKQAVAELVRRHDILRTSYFEGDDFPEQIVLDESPMQIGTVDLSKEADPSAALQHHVKAMRSTPLDIENGEVIKVDLVDLGGGEFALPFVCHHIGMDNGSSRTTMEQWTSIYDSLATGKDISAIASSKLSYSDFTIWHSHRMQSAEVRKDLEWWKLKFSGAPATSKLLPFAQAQRQSKIGSSRFVLRNTLELPSLNRMKRICARMEVTPFQFVLTAFRAFVHRYTQEDDLTILIVDGERPHPEIDDIIGFFANLIPVRCQNDCDSSFDNLVAEMKSTILEAMKRSHIPFDVIVNSVDVKKQASHFPLGQLIFNYRLYGKIPKYTTSDFVIERVQVDDIPTACELALEAYEDPESGLQMRLEYDNLLYGEQDMERFFENFFTFLKSIIQDHRQPIEEVEMCGPQELDHLRANCWAADLKPNAWNDQSVISKILEHANNVPDAIAIRNSNGDTISYANLVLNAKKVARSLQELGASPGDFIGVLSNPDIDMVTAMVGIVYNRCAYVPLDPKFATGRLQHMIQDSSTALVLVGEGLNDLAVDIAPGQTQFISIQSTFSIDPTPQSAEASPEDPFYVIYTSGTSGKPKGVLLTHQNTQAMLSSHNSLHGIDSRDTILFHSSICFDLSVAQLWGSLTAGATMALALSETRQDPTLLASFMRAAAVTVTYIPATQFSLLLEHNSTDLAECSSYRLALFAGEYLPVRTVQAIYDLRTPVTVVNQWGPTETTVQTSSNAIPYPSSTDLNLPVGVPISNCSHYVVNSNLKPVPATVVGELCVGGAQVCSGYLNRKESVERNFVVDPFASEGFRSRGWNRLYRTGDKGRFLPAGEIDFKGRISGDKQIKLRGFRIDLAEIENEIQAASEHIQQKLVNTVVLPRSPNGGDRLTDDSQLVAFIVPSKPYTMMEQASFVNALHAAIKNVLNEYMMPAGYQFMDTLPTLISGKVDRQKLLSYDLQLVFPSQRLYEAEEAEKSSQKSQTLLPSVTTIFKRVLKLAEERDVGPDDNFFELGGQSILLLRLRAVLKRNLKVDIPLAELFEICTPMGITQRIAGDGDGAGKQTLNSVEDSQIDWAKEAVLPNDSRYCLRSGLSFLSRSEMTDVLLTGADSFHGLHLLATILSTMPDKIVHVIGSEIQLTLSHALASFEKWHLFDKTVTRDSLTSRIRYVPGTLSSAHFGLTNQEFMRLGRTVQVIYHAGGHVSLLKTYSDLKRLNVGSTLDLIEIASHGLHLTEIHYLSTWSAAHLQGWSDAKRTLPSINLSESSLNHFQPGSDDKFGYLKSRWVSEMLLDEAASRGFPVSIYRASAIIATAKSGLETPEDNFTHNIILDMITMGKIPDINNGGPSFSIDFMPVDYLTTTLVSLAASDLIRSYSKKTSYYHIGNPSPLKLGDLPRLLPKIRGDGLAGEVLPLAKWEQLMERRAVEGKTELEWAVTKEYLDLGHNMFSLENPQTVKALARLGDRRYKADCPPVDEVFLKEMLRRRGAAV